MRTKRKGETSFKSTAFGIISRSELIPLEIDGIKRSWDFVLHKYKQGKIVFNPTFVKQIHKVGFAWIFPEFGGKYRNIDVVVSKHIPPKFYLVPELMKDFSEDLKTRLKHLPGLGDIDFIDRLIELLAWAHHRFLWIHPFQDYNGRIARMFMNIILLYLSLPPIRLKVETDIGRRRYVQALAAADNGDYTSLENIIRSAIERAAKAL